MIKPIWKGGGWGRAGNIDFFQKASGRETLTMTSLVGYKCSGYFFKSSGISIIGFFACLFLMFAVIVLVFSKVIVKHLIPQVEY